MSSALGLAWQVDDSNGSAGAVVAGLALIVFYLALIVVMIASAWKVFEKAGQPGWAALIPIYNF